MTAPLRADAERNRQRLLAAAKDLFATRGLDVTLDDVARHAGVGTGTAYRRFPNKDALIDALMVDRIGELGEIAKECLEEPDPWVGLTSYFDRALALQAADRGLKEVLFSSGRGRERSNHARRAIAPVVTKLVRRAKEAGVVRDDISTERRAAHQLHAQHDRRLQPRHRARPLQALPGDRARRSSAPRRPRSAAGGSAEGRRLPGRHGHAGSPELRVRAGSPGSSRRCRRGR